MRPRSAPIAPVPVTAPGETLASLQRLADAALAYLSQDELLGELLTRVVEILRADTAAILLLDETGERLVARAAHGIEEEVEQRVAIPLGAGFAGRVAAGRRAVRIDDVDAADIHNPILREKGIRSLLGVPLLVEGRVLGVLHVGSLVPRRFTEEESALLQLAADRAALAIAQATLYQQERAARERAEAATRQLQSLQRVTDAALAYLPQDDLLSELLRRVAEIVRADTAAILLLGADGRELHPRAAKGIEAGERSAPVPVGRGFAGRIAADRRAVRIDDVSRAEILNPVLRERGIRSLLGVPLLVEGRVLGVLHVGSLAPRRFTDEDRELLQLAADRAALAIEYAELYEQRHLAETLQRHLLPDLRGVRGVEVASRYLPASQKTMGGDWYDAFALPGGRVALAVGDVVGHGVSAAAVMAQLRTALRAYAVDGHPPAEVVERMNHVMWQLGPRAMTTLAYVVLDPEHGTLEHVSAGHPPPLAIAPDGRAGYLPVATNVPLAVAPVVGYRSRVHPYPLGATILLYTDGLVERRGELLDVGLERLREAAAGVPAAEAACARIVATLVPEQRADDVALIALRVPAPPAVLRQEWPTERSALVAIRQQLRRWLRAQGASEDETYDITVAAQEACANAIEHAYRPGPHSFELEARCDGGRVRLTVRDRGRWRAPRGEHRGRGLRLMRMLMDDVAIRPGDEGTLVVLERALRGRRP